jgi:ligand-binding SRPBCC domain-containing protein
MMKTYTLKKTQWLPIQANQAWDFFSSPRNLSAITPEYMNFKIEEISGGDKMYSGQIIKYTVSVLPFVRMNWITEIKHVTEPSFFVDEQRFGPYKLWHHQHSFTEVRGGVEMTDEVNYALPLGFLGRLAHWLFVGRQLNSIFDYRYKVLQDLFKDQTIRKSA